MPALRGDVLWGYPEVHDYEWSGVHTTAISIYAPPTLRRIGWYAEDFRPLLLPLLCSHHFGRRRRDDDRLGWDGIMNVCVHCRCSAICIWLGKDEFLRRLSRCHLCLGFAYTGGAANRVTLVGARLVQPTCLAWEHAIDSHVVGAIICSRCNASRAATATAVDSTADDVPAWAKRLTK